MGTTYVYDEPSTPACESEHWKQLPHEPSDRLIHNLDELKTEFRSTILAQESATDTVETRGQKLALWSCILGYCEALSTHKYPERRFQIYPIPLDALARLVQTEFLNSLNGIGAKDHRHAAQLVSNQIWSRVVSKKNVKDEQHANSLYICTRGRIDGKSLDCFGAALCTVIGLQCLGYKSMLTLSEDHAYESHVNDVNEETEDIPRRQVQKLATCEVAIPGNTKSQQSKRGREIGETFADSKTTRSPETSWLYMGKCPVLCESMQMTLAAALANVNCSIETKKGSFCIQTSSGPLFDLKRELLWILKDHGHLSTFPFALVELGDCEENRTSERGEKWVTVAELGPEHPVLTIEALYHEAIAICRDKYQDGQAYPYCYAGHYHKDGGRDGGAEAEYRLVEALRCYSQASRVASGCVYEWGDSLELTKVMVKLSELIFNQILQKDGQPRRWCCKENGVAAGTWLLAFYDSLLLWEELTGSPFLSILTASHKTGIAKSFALLDHDVRNDAIARMLVSNDSPLSMQPITSTQLQYFYNPRSKRLQPSGLLMTALKRPKISVSDMELAIVVQESQDGKRAKRVRRAASK